VVLFWPKNGPNYVAYPRCGTTSGDFPWLVLVPLGLAYTLDWCYVSCSSMPLPHVLVGDTRSAKNLRILQDLKWGRMCVVKTPKPFPFERWGFDNAVFPAWLARQEWNANIFMRRLEAAQQVDSDPFMAITPDIVAGGLRSLDFSNEWRLSRRLPDDWPWYLAVQDGMSIADVESCLHLYDGIFLGGTTRFKEQAYRWRALAHKHQRKFHYGRAGTFSKLVSAFKVAADSLDSSFPLWTAQRMRLFVAWWQGLEEQTSLEFSA